MGVDIPFPGQMLAHLDLLRGRRQTFYAMVLWQAMYMWRDTERTGLAQ